jgi:peptide/nickel transport system substrate-binding protein
MTILGDSYAVISMIYDRLVALDPDTGLPAPWLAESWEASDDGLTLTFTLRDGITFTDGTPLDAAAVKFNLDRWINLESAGTVDLGTLESVDAQDERTVVLSISEPFAPIYSSLSALAIHSPTAYEADPENFGRNPVGSGPFMLTEWEPGTRLRLERNPDYVNYYPFDENEGAAYLDAIEIYIITEAATQTAAFENGELDVLRIGREDYARLEAMPDVTIQTVLESTVMYHLQYADEPPYNDVAFRQAVSYAINADQIVELAYLDGAAINQCPIATALTGHDPELCAEHGYTYDQEMAKQLLADAGWTDADGDGFVEFAGVTEPIVLYTYGPNPAEQRAIELMQGDLQAAGIQADIRVLEIASLVDGISAARSSSCTSAGVTPIR